MGSQATTLWDNSEKWFVGKSLKGKRALQATLLSTVNASERGKNWGYNPGAKGALSQKRCAASNN